MTAFLRDNRVRVEILADDVWESFTPGGGWVLEVPSTERQADGAAACLYQVEEGEQRHCLWPWRWYQDGKLVCEGPELNIQVLGPSAAFKLPSLARPEDHGLVRT